MRSLSLLAVVVAALSSFACGSAAPEAGSPTEEAALQMVEIEAVANGDGDFRTVPVTVEPSTGTCTVDGVRFGRCTLTRTATSDIVGQTLSVCELEVDGGATFLWQCDKNAEMERLEELPWHCPAG
jgi:hypothetical protein